MTHSTFRNLALKGTLARSLGIAAISFAGFAAQAEVIFSNIPAALAPNYPSLGYQATSTSEFGNQIQFGGTARDLNSVTVTMSNWALASTYGASNAGYQHALTFNIYGDAAAAAAGTALGSVTTNAFVPWRPEASANCTNGGYGANCSNGLAFNVTFDFSALGLILPEEIVFGLAFNTQSYGADPTGAAGPYNSLNFALGGAPTVGTDVDADGVFWNTSFQPFLTSGTAGTFGPDSAWSPYVPMVSFDAGANAVPEPGTLALTGVAALALVALRRRRRVG